MRAEKRTEQPEGAPWVANADIASRVERVLKVFGAVDDLHTDMEALHKKQVSAIMRINDAAISTGIAGPSTALLGEFEDSRERSEKALLNFLTGMLHDEFSGLRGDNLHFAYRRVLSQVRVKETPSNREFSERFIETAARRAENFEIRTALTFLFGFDSMQVVPRPRGEIRPVPPRPDQMTKEKAHWDHGAGGP